MVERLRSMSFRVFRRAEEKALKVLQSRLGFTPRYTNWLRQHYWLTVSHPQSVKLRWNGTDLSDRYPVKAYDASETFVACLHNVEVIGHPAVALSGREIIMENSLSKPANLNKSRLPTALAKSTFKRPRYIDQAIILTHLWSKNYYHWMFETLPRLRFLDLIDGVRPNLLINPQPALWQLDSLYRLGVDSVDLIEQDPGMRYLIGTTYVTSNLREIQISGLNPTVVSWLRERLSGPDYALPGHSSFPERILVSRRQATSRKIVNFEAFERALAVRGFTTVILEQMSFADQVELFRRARIVIGVHGAGLTNLLFSDHASLIEIFQPEKPAWHYANLCGLLSIPYYPYTASAVGEDVLIDIDAFTKQFRGLF